VEVFIFSDAEWLIGIVKIIYLPNIQEHFLSMDRLSFILYKLSQKTDHSFGFFKNNDTGSQPSSHSCYCNKMFKMKINFMYDL